MKQLLFLAICLFGFISLFSQAKTEILTNKGVIELSKAGFGKDMILSKIESSTCKFDVTTAALIELKKQGVSEDVVKAIMDRSSVSTQPAKTQSLNREMASPAKSTASLATAVNMMNHVYSLNKTSRAVIPLEKAVAGIRTKQGPFGGSVMIHVEGAKSATRIAANQSQVFVVNTGSGVLPELLLYKLKPGKNKREVASMKVNSFTGMKTGEDVITLNIIKLEDGIFQITPSSTLASGEYLFSAKPVAGASSSDAYTFGID